MNISNNVCLERGHKVILECDWIRTPNDIARAYCQQMNLEFKREQRPGDPADAHNQQTRQYSQGSKAIKAGKVRNESGIADEIVEGSACDLGGLCGCILRG